MSDLSKDLEEGEWICCFDFFFLDFFWMLAKILGEQHLSLSAMLKVVQHKFLGIGSMFETANTVSSIVNKLKT